jgi:hypothetical protein
MLNFTKSREIDAVQKIKAAGGMKLGFKKIDD